MLIVYLTLHSTTWSLKSLQIVLTLCSKDTGLRQQSQFFRRSLIYLLLRTYDFSTLEKTETANRVG